MPLNRKVCKKDICSAIRSATEGMFVAGTLSLEEFNKFLCRCSPIDSEDADKVKSLVKDVVFSDDDFN